jgi:hypothetical protein
MSMSQLGEVRIDVPSRILRHIVPVDDEAHRIELAGEIVHVAARDDAYVEFWVRTPLIPQASFVYAFWVSGTGAVVPSDAIHVGTAIAPGGLLVWHLFAIAVPQ